MEAKGFYTEKKAPSRCAETKKILAEQTTLAHRARHEFIEYVAISAYLAVCFAALLFYKAAILGSEGFEFTRFGLAVAKALILGKFVLVLESLRIGDGEKSAGALFVDVLKKASLFTLLLIPLTIIEEVIVGYFHGQGARDVLKGFAGGTAPEATATVILMFLILIPYFAYREIAARLGEAELAKLLFERQPSNH